MRPPLEKLSCARGAPMGRAECASDPTAKMYLYKLKMIDGDYDEGGAYWGSGTPMWRAVSKHAENELFVRAHTRDDAKALVRDRIPNARFYK